MRLVTLGQLHADARLYADQRNSNFVTEAELTRLINLQLAELYDILVAARGHDYYAATDAIDLEAGTAAYDLPDDFYQLQAINLEWAADEHEPIKALNHQQDIWVFASHAAEWDRWTRKRYRVQNGAVTFYPTPVSGVTARMYYIPQCPELADLDEDTFDGVNGWEKLVALGVAMELLEIEEAGSGSRLQAMYDRQYERISKLASDRDVERPRRCMYPPAFVEDD